MGIFGDKDSIVGAALGVGGAFDKNRKTDSATVFGAAFGASIGSGKKWTMEDSIKLGAAINASNAWKCQPLFQCRDAFVLIDAAGGAIGNGN